MTAAGGEPANPLASNTARTVCAALVFLASLAAYVATLAPTVTFVDSGELIVAARNLGVAHPPGTPLYVMLAHVATLVPIGNVAVRVNFASALFAALAAAMLALLVVEALRLADVPVPAKTRKPRESRARVKRRRGMPGAPIRTARTEASGERAGALRWVIAFTPACVAGLLFAFSRTLWSFATVAEVYTLNSLLTLGIFVLAFRWRRLALMARQNAGHQTSRATRDGTLYLAAFLFGLALGVHHVTVGVTLPALALLVYRTDGLGFFTSRRLAYAALLACAGLFATYAYLPLAASRSPVLNWGDPRTLERIWWHVSGRQYQVYMTFSLEQMLGQAAAFGALAASEFGPWWCPAGLVLAFLGALDALRRDRMTFYIVALLIIADLAYALNYDIAEDKGAYYLPSFIAVAMAAGLGARWLLARALTAGAHARVASTLAIIGVLLGPAGAVAGNVALCDRRQYLLAADYIDNIERTIGPGGMLLTSDWQVYSPLLYLREIEGQRRDVVAIDVSLLRRSWYVEYLRAAYPALIARTRGPVDAYLEDLTAWEQDPGAFARSRTLTQRIDTRFHEMIMALIRAHLRESAVYATHEVVLEAGTPDPALAREISRSYQLIPQGLVFELSADSRAQAPAALRLETRGLVDGTLRFEPDDGVMVKVRPVYLNMLLNRGRYLAARGRHDLAVDAFKRALALDPAFAAAEQGIAHSADAMRATQ